MATEKHQDERSDPFFSALGSTQLLDFLFVDSYDNFAVAHFCSGDKGFLPFTMKIMDCGALRRFVKSPLKEEYGMLKQSPANVTIAALYSVL